MSGDQAILRTTLLEGLVAAASENVDAGNDGIALFELARVYLPSGGAAAGGALARRRDRRRAASRRRAAPSRCSTTLSISSFGPSGTVLPFLHPGKAATTAAGWLGELHPALLDGTWGVFELDLDDADGADSRADPLRRRDHVPAAAPGLAVVVAEEVEAATLVDAALEAGAPELREARVFDVYRGDQVGEGRKSVAIHLSLQVPDRDALRRRRGRRARASRRRARDAARRGVARAANRRPPFCVGDPMAWLRRAC